MRCTTCKKDKPKSKFYLRTSRPKGVTSSCRKCLGIEMTKWQMRKGKSIVTKLRKRLWRYKLSVTQYQKLMKQQKGICPICMTRPAESIDHSHINGKVRAILCYRCNSGLGAFEDSITLLEHAVKYILSYE